MNATWPGNALWLGARWQGGHWGWDDGAEATRLDWAPGQPSAGANQTGEPLLVMVSDGKIHDSDLGSPPYLFGVMCQESTNSLAKNSTIDAITSGADRADPKAEVKNDTSETRLVAKEDEDAGDDHAWNMPRWLSIFR